MVQPGGASPTSAGYPNGFDIRDFARTLKLKQSATTDDLLSTVSELEHRFGNPEVAKIKKIKEFVLWSCLSLVSGCAFIMAFYTLIPGYENLAMLLGGSFAMLSAYSISRTIKAPFSTKTVLDTDRFRYIRELLTEFGFDGSTKLDLYVDLRRYDKKVFRTWSGRFGTSSTRPTAAFARNTAVNSKG